MRWCWRAGEVLGLALLLGVLRLSLRWFLWASTGSLLRVSLVFLFLLCLSGRRPGAGLWLGVRLLGLWVCGLSADTADPLVVPAPSSYFLRLIPNRRSTERKRPALDAVPTPGWVKGFPFFPLTGRD